MNTNLNIATLPLPSMPASVGFQRRHRVAGIELNNGSLRRFQQVAQSLQSDRSPPDVDAIACAARQLTSRFSGRRRAPCIELRLRVLRALRAMSSETAWNLDPAKQQIIAMIADYAANQDRLVPDAVPVIGGLDDAVLVDLAWPSLQFDLGDYLDFRRLRVEEAIMSGVHPNALHFDRNNWLEARLAENAWRAHVRNRGCNSYVGQSAPPLFRMH